MVIGIFGSKTQINHVDFVLKQKYKTTNLNIYMTETCRIKKYIGLFIALCKIDVLYNIYNTPDIWKLFLVAKILRKKIITHWIGSDTLYFLNKGNIDHRFLKYVDVHLSCSDNIYQEMISVGIESTVLPIVPYEQIFIESTTPNEHAVMIYMPKGREELYGYHSLIKVFQKFSKLPFFIVANDDKEKFPFANVKPLGWLNKDEMGDLYNQVSIVLRFVEHDGLSMSIIEALAKGKSVIWNYDHDFVFKASNYEEIVATLENILSSQPKANTVSQKHILELHTPANFHNIFHNVENSVKRGDG